MPVLSRVVWRRLGAATAVFLVAVSFATGATPPAHAGPQNEPSEEQLRMAVREGLEELFTCGDDNDWCMLRNGGTLMFVRIVSFAKQSCESGRKPNAYFCRYHVVFDCRTNQNDTTDDALCHPFRANEDGRSTFQWIDSPEAPRWRIVLDE